MEQYIPKSALVAKIKRKKKSVSPAHFGKETYEDGYYRGLNEALFIIESLEVKEVDLCKEEERIWKDFNMAECRLSKNDLEKISKHFFELGMSVSNKAQKGEEYDRQKEIRRD